MEGDVADFTEQGDEEDTRHQVDSDVVSVHELFEEKERRVAGQWTVDHQEIAEFGHFERIVSR